MSVRPGTAVLNRDGSRISLQLNGVTNTLLTMYNYAPVLKIEIRAKQV
jgi:hypothetical protein